MVIIRHIYFIWFACALLFGIHGIFNKDTTIIFLKQLTSVELVWNKCCERWGCWTTSSRWCSVASEDTKNSHAHYNLWRTPTCLKNALQMREWMNKSPTKRREFIFWFWLWLAIEIICLKSALLKSILWFF